MEPEKTTGTLTAILQSTPLCELEDFFTENERSFANSVHPFSEYMRDRLRTKGISQQEVFLAADISEGYGYKILSEEKHTRQRDLIIRLCLAGQFTLDETQTALKLYGFSPLYARIRRDSVMILAINSQIHDPAKVSLLLCEHGFEPLYSSVE